MKETALPNVKEQMVFISHGDALEDAQKVEKYVREMVGAKTFLINTIGTVIGSHSGPGTIALFFMGDHR